MRLANLGGSALDGDARGPAGPGARGRRRTARRHAVLPGTERALSFAVRPSRRGHGPGQPHPRRVRWKGGRKRTLAVLDLPPAVSVHKLLYGQAPEVVYPVSVHNFTDGTSLSRRGQGLRQGPGGDARSTRPP